MIDSALSSSHFYYLVFLESEQLNSIGDVFNILKGNQDKEKIPSSSQQLPFYHVQVEIARALGSESILSLNSSRSDGPINFFWYDFYIGQLRGVEKKFFICYPYIKLGKYLDDCLTEAKIKRKVLKPSVERVLDYMKVNELGLNKTQAEQEGLLIEITKYSAAVKDDSISRVNIAGSNPLSSRVYELLSQDSRIGIEPLSLKLNCSKDGQTLDLSFDKLGNLRFWLKRESESTISPIMITSFEYFDEIKAFEDSSYISKLTLLEDE
ncbi:hypothetical protein ASE74_23530 [Pedobacter sp. Leaf216]|uniref:hypothetical protein n=1 Tax=Pedobacter sp. Leaf216 TaxID=1735684 RepID=UPI0006FE6261|nr:hypothetical protein [Pedobacter sp. Leaf216]KQM70355.1 hypothetical protein ASE74_23530 [Pedobacter sp. Leaf216]